MKRRKILIGLPLLIGGGLLSYAGFKWIRWNTSPDLDHLTRSRQLIAALADTIIPKTDSPGASECGVQDFIIKTVRDCTGIITQHKFIEGLRELEEYVKAEFGRSFQECSSVEKIRTLDYFSSNDRPWPGLLGKVQGRYLGSPFFTTLKKYCIRGYFTSEGGATLALRYSHVPGKYNACEPYHSGEKAWATS